jgi:hypothetical protein
MYKKFNAKRAAAMLFVYSPVLSDEDVKCIHKAGGDIKDIAASILEHGPPFTRHEVMTLVKAAGDMPDHNFEKEGDAWKDDTLQKYAKYIHNYKYTYTDEAKKVDPKIDTSIEHNGPMAQDIEQVNPAAIQNDPKTGYKTVDTGRLALMNAGAIADLAREIEGLKNGAS